MDSNNSSASPPGNMGEATTKNCENVDCKKDFMDEILDDLSVVLRCKERVQADRPVQGTRWQIYAVFAYGFVTLKIRDLLEDMRLWETRPFVRKYRLPEGCDVEELKIRLAKIGVQTIVPPPGYLDISPEIVNPGGAAVDAAVPKEGGQ